MKLHHLFITCGLLVVTVCAQNSNTEEGMQDCPMHKGHMTDSRHALVDKNGTLAMGFPQDTTAHHFRMYSDGGAIGVTVNDPNDTTNVNAIRSHLSHIASMFKDGDFSTPMFVHDGIPPGVTSMKLLKDKIQYKYEEMPSGGRVRIESDDALALSAIHDFLRFQISDHQTGDPLISADPH